jgi:pyruvate dehydrogenase E2 component (dihydrolipoamide acetyltransferase)
MTSKSAVANDELIQQLENMGLARGSYDLVAVDRLRRIIATRMTEAIREVPQFPLHMDVRLDALFERRSRHNSRQAMPRISINDLVIKAAALALTEVPEANASFTQDAIVHHRSADVAVVVAIRNGLVTPIVRNAHSKSVVEIATEMKDLAARAQTMRLKPDEYNGGTFSISNLGMYGITSFGSIINRPQGAILSVGCSRETPVLSAGALANINIMTVTLTCDHRVIDGVIGARWLQAFRNHIEAPDGLFADIAQQTP